MSLEDVGARLITEGESQFLSAMMKAQKAVHGVGDESTTAQGPMKGLSAMTLTLANAMGQALYNAAIAAGRAVLEFGKQSITAASDLNETVSKVGIVFGDQSDKVIEFGKNAALSLGMSENAALTAAGTYGNLFRAMGMTETTSADMSTNLIQLAGDLASFNNMDPTEVLDKLRAGLTGESEPLKSLGVNINEEIIRQEAMNLGLVKGKDKLTAAAKAQAAYSLILKQTTLAQGDFNRTSDGLANQQRINAALIENTKAALGGALLPVVNLVMKAFNTWLASPAFQKGMENFTAGVMAIIGWFTDLVSAIDDAGAASSEVFQVLSMVLGDDVANMVLEVIYWFTQIPAIVDGVMQSLLAIVQPALDILSGWWEENSYTVIATLSSMWASVQQIFDSISAAITQVIAYIAPMIQMFLTSLAQWWADNGTKIMATVQVLWAAVANLFSAAAGLIAAIVGALVRVIMAFWTAHGAEVMTFLTGLWTFIAGLFTTVTQTIALIFEAFTALLNGDTEEFSAKMQEAWDYLWSAIRGAAETAWASLSAWFQSIIKAIVGFFTNTNWAAVGKSIVDGIWNGLKNAWDWLVTKVKELAQKLFDAAMSAIKGGSPSKLFMEVGLSMTTGIEKGIMDSIMRPASAIASTTQAALGAARAVAAGPVTNNYANNYNLSVMTSQSPQVVTRSFAMMKMLAG